MHSFAKSPNIQFTRFDNRLGTANTMAMDFRMLMRQLGLLLAVLSACMAMVTVVELVSWSTSQVAEQMAVQALLVTAGLGGAIGLTMWLLGREMHDHFMGRREAMLLVALSWILGAALSGLPYFLWYWFGGAVMPDHPFRSPVACYFEAMSGLTTTGATVLSDVELVPRALLLWRAMTHWLGGLGIVVLFVAVLPSLGVGGKKLYQVEAPGPSQPGVRPRIRETARVLWLIYLSLTLAQTLALWAAGMTLFDAVCHTFATLATGGFSTWNASIGHYAANDMIQIIVIVFMVLAGVNFGLYYQALNRRWRDVLRDPELRLYLSIIAVCTALICLSVYGRSYILTTGEEVEYGFFGTVLMSLFQVVTIQTTTGFCTVDFNLWSFFPQAILVGLMFVGSSAGSTGGGIKVIRILICFKLLIAQIERVFRPAVVRPIRVGKASVDEEMQRSVLTYIITLLLLFVMGGVLIMLIEGPDVHYLTAGTAAAATLNNIGPGLGLVGPVGNYGFFSDGSKLVMSALMALGRLEVYALLVLFLPSFWRQG